MKRIDITMLSQEEPSVEELKEKLWAFKRDSNALAVSVETIQSIDLIQITGTMINIKMQ